MKGAERSACDFGARRRKIFRDRPRVRHMASAPHPSFFQSASVRRMGAALGSGRQRRYGNECSVRSAPPPWAEDASPMRRAGVCAASMERAACVGCVDGPRDCPADVSSVSRTPLSRNGEGRLRVPPPWSIPTWCIPIVAGRPPHPRRESAHALRSMMNGPGPCAPDLHPSASELRRVCPRSVMT